MRNELVGMFANQATDLLEGIMKKVMIISLICSVQMGWVAAQRVNRNSLRAFLFPPELVMKNQEELQLTDEQRDLIMQEVQQIQSEFTALQWDLEREMEKLTALLRGVTLEEDAILQQLETVLELERKVKRSQLQLAVRIRNALNEDQVRTLRRLRIRANAEQRLRSRAEPSGDN